MSALSIRLFGGIELRSRDDVAFALQPSVQVFLAYLLLNRERYHCREVLSAHFWGDRDDGHARRCLNTTLWRLRQELEEAGTPRGTLVQTNHAGEIGVNCGDDIWLDVAEFEEKARRGLTPALSEMSPQMAAHLEEAVALYVGDLLEAVYADWVLVHRERLRALYIKCLKRLMHFHRTRHAYERSIAYGRKILAIDPLREEVHRQVMRLYELNGERAEALRQYDRCRQILARELDTEPMPEIQAHYRQLLTLSSREAIPSNLQPGAREPEDLEQALSQLDQALLALNSLREHLHRALQGGGTAGC